MSYIKIFFKYLSVLFFTGLINIALAVDNKTVIVIVPLEHTAMSQIIHGIEESLRDTGSKIVIKNAQGDINIMSALIKQIPKDIGLIMPIGTLASQMTISHIKNKPIICVAADLKSTINSKFITGVNDEIPIKTVLSKLPKLDKIAVIYSASEKVIPEIDELKTFANDQSIKLHLTMIQSLTDLTIAMKNAPNDTQAFLVLKDHLVVSAINSIIQEANKRQIPIIASDEGSVINGASLAIGVKESDIGIAAGLIAKSVLSGIDIKDIKYQTMNKLVVFVNKDAIDKQKILTKEQINNIELPLIEFKGSRQ